MRKQIATVALLLAVGAGSAGTRAQTTAGMVPFTMDHRAGLASHSPVDVSFLLDAPAGKHGFLVVKNGHLATSDAQRVRLWGVNITDWSAGSRQIPEKVDAALWASTLARFGVNCVRFQFLDLKEPRGLLDTTRADTRALDPRQLDREDYFIAELEKRGIYIDFNLLVGRPFNTADGVHDAAALHEGAKGTSLFDARMIELQKEYARELLTHRNPYTGHPYTEDPAVAVIEINNENALNIGYRAPSPFYLVELTGMYNQWLATHRTPEQIDKLRQIVSSVTAVDAEPGATAHTASLRALPLLASKGDAATAQPLRFYAEAEFYDELQRTYFENMERYVKSTLGSKSLVMATADHSHANSGYPTLLATAGMDVMDGHDYWQHPEMYVRKAPMVNDPLHSTVVELSRSAIAGKPYTASEVNNPFPNDYGGEGIPILAAYALLQDWDAILWYTFEPKAEPAWKPVVGDPFDISHDPVKMPELAQGALMFLRGDVAAARTVAERSYTRAEVFDSMLLPAASERPYFTPGFPLALPLEHEVRVQSLDGAPTRPFVDASSFASTSPIVSDTQQLAWYSSPRETGLVTIDTPRTEGLIGFVTANGKSVRHLSTELRNSFCTVLLSSLDGKPIAQSARMLLVAGGRVENTGQTWNIAGTDLTDWGVSPTLIEQVAGNLSLSSLDPAGAVMLQPLDGAGRPKGPAVAATKDGVNWRLHLGDTATTWYEVSVTR
ncbi:hypothetical protein [Acidipila sp. EB88]|uniref:hypothetical protein n=1 Tax=Acidipila sp. EB88 TaxID=2305226 RepID=UPI000F5DC0EF|nr:hypothetical protein [Acidipila sp. EB88]RRA49130.1 hypothetical protein D1Y84_13475 [Acidipila sp. EB88]